MDNGNNIIIPHKSKIYGDPVSGDIKNALRALENKEISAVELLNETYKRIKTGGLNAYICLNEERAYERALAYDNGAVKGRLAGVPIAIKDNTDVEGLPTTCASNALRHVQKAQKNAALVQKLIDEGAVITGKTNMDEFAMGSSNLTSAFGGVLNPLDNSRVCGGSSGGSACAVAANQCFAALGSDTGGSIRQPASYCGVVGLKPSSGKIDKSGMYPLAPLFDEPGPIARTAGDCELLFNIMSGVNTKPFKFKDKPVIGVIGDLNLKWSDASNAMQAAIKRFDTLGFRVVNVSVPLFSCAHEVYGAQGYAQMYQSISGLNLNEDLLGYEVKKRVRAGLSCLMNPNIIDAAQKMKIEMISQFNTALSVCDVIITPSAPTAAFCIDEDKNSDAVKYSDFFTQPPSVCGLSALSVPFYKTAQNLPLGIQIIGLDEPQVFSVAKLIENLTLM